MKKRLVSLVLVLSLVLGSMSMGFAAGTLTTGIEDAKVVKAVERLAAFGIVNGMEDGKYHPELKVTREQFAKLLVEALGLGSAANAAQGATKFSDVEAARWSAGYVNVATGQGILKGYPDGTFGPAKEVTYAEALTMLVRALGYKDEFLPGSWPGNYVAKAAGLGITSGVNFSADSVTADRGSVAVMVDNTLDAKIVKVKEFGSVTTYEETQLTLLEDKLEIDKYDNLRLVKNQRLDDSLDANELAFVATKDDAKLITEELDKGDESNAVEVKAGVDTEALMGMKVKVYVNDDDEIVYLEKDSTEKAVVDQIDEISGKDISLYVLDDEYTLADDAYAYVTGAEDDVVKADAAGDFAVGEFGRVIVSGDEIVFADMFKADETDNTGMVVTSVDKAAKEITGVVGAGAGTPDDEFVVNLEDDYDEIIVMNAKTRATMTLDDIAANDVVYVSAQTIDGDDYAVVQVVKDNKIEGEFGKYKAEEAVIGGKSYDLTMVGDVVYATVSSNDNDDIYSYSDEFDNGTVLEDVYGEDVVAITDVVDRVMHITTSAAATSGSMYGVVDKYYDGGERVRLYVASEDKLVTYTFEEDDDSNVADPGEFVKFKLNKDGEIADGKYDAVSGTVYTVDTEFGEDTIKTTQGKTFSVDEKSSVFVNAPDNSAYPITIDTDDCEPVKWADIAEDDVNANTKFVVFADENNEIDAALFFTGLESTSDEEAAYIVDTFKQDGDEAATVDFYGGAVEDIVVDSKSEAAANDEMVAVVKKQSDGELEVMAYITDAGVKGSSEDFDIVTGKVAKKDGDFVYLEGKTTAYKLTTGTLVYDEDEKKSKSNISKGDFVDFVVEDGKNVRVAKLLDEARPGVVVDAAVTNVINLITDLPAVANMTLADEADVVAARTAYNALSVAQKANVTNYSALTAAEAKIVELKGGAGEEVAFQFNVYNSTVPGKKQVTVKFTGTENPADYTVEVADVELTYNTTLGVFAGTVNEADAVEGNVVITEK